MSAEVLGFRGLTLILLTWRIGWAPNNANRWQMVFNLTFKGLTKKQFLKRFGQLSVFSNIFPKVQNLWYLEMHVFCDVMQCRLVNSYLVTIYQPTVFNISDDPNIQWNRSGNPRTQIPTSAPKQKLPRPSDLYVFWKTPLVFFFHTVDRIVLNECI
jgi:hypothetical protein